MEEEEKKTMHWDLKKVPSNRIEGKFENKVGDKRRTFRMRLFIPMKMLVHPRVRRKIDH